MLEIMLAFLKRLLRRLKRLLRLLETENAVNEYLDLDEFVASISVAWTYGL